MPLLPYNSIGGYAIGFTASTVIDSNGNIFAAGISAAGATFTGLARFNAGISAAGGTFSSQARFLSGISAAGGTFTNNVLMTNNLSVANTILTDNISAYSGILLRLNDTSGSRIYLGDISYQNNGTYINLDDNAAAVIHSCPYGTIYFGDADGLYNSHHISYYSPTGTFSGNASSTINDFATISSNNGFYETANSIRVTNNARSWFL